MVKTESPAEQRMILHHVSWETYQRLLCDYEDSSALRFTYDQGTLEIMTPQIEHEGFNRFIQVLLIAVEEVTGTELYNYGSTTFSREDLQKGFEADTCFYIKNIDRVRGKTRLDLHVDPPPDLVVEIDITHASLNKLPIYAQIGVPEVWRYTGGAMVILLLSADRYVPAQSSRAVPVVTADALTRLVKASAGLSQAGWLRLAREWVSSSAQSGR
jgi:Uma2 family endonuclease